MAIKVSAVASTARTGGGFESRCVLVQVDGRGEAAVDRERASEERGKEGLYPPCSEDH
jgi:hypothetical protein